MNKARVNHPTGRVWLQLSRSKAAVREGSQWERAQAQPQATKTQGETPWQHAWWEKQRASPEAWAQDYPAAPVSQLSNAA